ncbi:hypothetical protein [Nannocystis pusilla]|uniref:hypothetical protein n=1 Tax=Nannocystis pusilla TaxID=889268 RepID=UPI003DA1E8C1
MTGWLSPEDMALEAELGGGQGPLAAQDAEALAGVAEGGDLVGAEGAAEVGLAAEARRRTGEEVFAGALVVVLQAPARVDEPQLLGGRSGPVLQAPADQRDCPIGQEIGPQGDVGQLLEVPLLALAGGRGGGVDEGVEHARPDRGVRVATADGPGRDLAQGPQSLAARALRVLLEVAEGEGARLGTCPEEQVSADEMLLPLGAGGDLRAHGLGADAISLGREGHGEVGARGGGALVDLGGGVAEVGLAGEPGDRLVEVILGEEQLRALADQQRAQRATCPFGQARAGPLELEQAALEAAAADLQQGGEEVEEEAGVVEGRLGGVLHQLAAAAELVERGVELVAQEQAGGLGQSLGQGPLAALVRRLGELEQDAQVGVAGEDLGDPSDRQRELEVGVAGALRQRLAQARGCAGVVAAEAEFAGLGDRAGDLLGRALLGDLAEDRAHALGPPAEGGAHRAQRVLVFVLRLAGVVAAHRACSGAIGTAAIWARRSASRGSSARSSAAAVLRASLTEETGCGAASLAGGGGGSAGGSAACSSRSITRCSSDCSWSPS